LSDEKRTDVAEQAHAVFTEAIRDPHRRRQLAEHPQETFEEAGVDFDQLPADLQQLLKDLSYEELRLLARMNDTLEASGLIEQRQSASGLSTVCKF
jgi:DNA-binding MarR family transcriptional regulator